MSVSSPAVLFLIFNRPEITARAFKSIAAARPKQLFIAADGPRPSRQGEAERCEATRQTVLASIDWDCDVKTLFRETNLGCGVAVSQAINWFFGHVEAGIILEDDIVAEASFFAFCSELLEKYKDSPDVMLIGGMNFLPSSKMKSDTSYIFSNYATTWGWASWRRAWNGYDFSMAKWTDSEIQTLSLKGLPPPQKSFFRVLFDATAASRPSTTWDYQWWFHRFVRRGFGITPAKNLTRNIGFVEEATHTFDAETEIKEAKTWPVSFPLIHPQRLAVDRASDRKLEREHYRTRPQSIFSRIQNFFFRLRRYIGKRFGKTRAEP